MIQQILQLRPRVEELGQPLEPEDTIHLCATSTARALEWVQALQHAGVTACCGVHGLESEGEETDGTNSSNRCSHFHPAHNGEGTEAGPKDDGRAGHPDQDDIEIVSVSGARVLNMMPENVDQITRLTQSMPASLRVLHIRNNTLLESSKAQMSAVCQLLHAIPSHNLSQLDVAGLLVSRSLIEGLAALVASNCNLSILGVHLAAGQGGHEVSVEWTPLVEALSKNNKIRTLDLRDTDFGEEATTHLARVLQDQQSIKELSLCNCNVTGPDHVFDLAACPTSPRQKLGDISK